ncbi:hypothetical protein D9758_010148 [Tetrapyrgos nigripes]|uniref:Uncharacterized protein n=1 Tax=Tetrapyrgos nigripes TaxID=182062 RepID=A0A8H5FRZ5_9AGAR|nr:hypothetical protein D9758_010148 [Tetrapyrgos nigripes]
MFYSFDITASGKLETLQYRRAGQTRQDGRYIFECRNFDMLEQWETVNQCCQRLSKALVWADLYRQRIIRVYVDEGEGTYGIICEHRRSVIGTPIPADALQNAKVGKQWRRWPSAIHSIKKEGDIEEGDIVVAQNSITTLKMMYAPRKRYKQFFMKQAKTAGTTKYIRMVSGGNRKREGSQEVRGVLPDPRCFRRDARYDLEQFLTKTCRLARIVFGRLWSGIRKFGPRVLGLEGRDACGRFVGQSSGELAFKWKEGLRLRLRGINLPHWNQDFCRHAHPTKSVFTVRDDWYANYMQCTWFARTSCFCPTFSSIHVLKAPSPQKLRACAVPTLSYRFASSAGTSSLNHDASPPATRRQPTPAQASRASANAIRIAMENGDLESAFTVAQAVRVSNGSSAVYEDTPEFDVDTALKFPFPTPPRLPMHALLHGLLRADLSMKAQVHVQRMMQDGIRIRTKTLESVIEETLKLGQRIHPLRDDEFYLRMKTQLPMLSQHGSLLHLYPSFALTPSLQGGIGILQAAKKFKNARTDRMFTSVIRACTLHGELMAAALIFVSFVKDYVVKDTLLKRVHSPPVSRTPKAKKNIYGIYNHLKVVSPGRPGFHQLQNILSSIHRDVLEDIAKDDETPSEVARQVALQALAYLTMILDWRQLPCEASLLIKTLYRCPRLDNAVWIVVDGRSQRVNAYDYFHSVLKRLLDSLPEYDHRDDIAYLKKLGDERLEDWSPSLKLTRPLSTESCNALLHYALRHRFSPLLANKVFEYLENANPPKRDLVTYNIVLTSGRVLRAPYMVEETIHLLKETSSPVLRIKRPPSSRSMERGSSPFLPVAEPPFTDLQPQQMDSSIGRDYRFTRALAHLQQERLKIPHPITDLGADSYTITAYISYLVATGRSHLVADILFDFLPELAVVNHPSWANLTPKQIQVLKLQSTDECLRRILRYGPHFFVVVLNALYKAGKTGLTERVWLLAKKAERKSWDPTFAEVFDPWLLPVHAYTIMIELYAREAKKTPLKLAETFKKESREIQWAPRQNRFVKGWAKYLLKRATQRQQNLHRFTAGRTRAVGVYSYMLRAVYQIYASFKDILQKNGLIHTDLSQFRKLESSLPRPDAMFFNAMLSVTTYHPMMRRRRARTTAAHWRQHSRFANWLFAQYGIPRAFNNVYLKEVAQDIIDAGWKLPLGVQYLLIGRSDGLGIRRLKPRKRIYMTPWAFQSLPPERRLAGPFSLPTYKERGLPLGRRPAWATRYYEHTKRTQSRK